MNLLLANIIRLFHILVVLFILVTPFITKDFMILLLHITSCISLIVHWMSNNSICSLTLLESKLRGIEIHHSFIYEFIAPIYEFLHIPIISENNLSTFIYVLVVSLMFFSIYRLSKAKLPLPLRKNDDPMK